MALLDPDRDVSLKGDLHGQCCCCDRRFTEFRLAMSRHVVPLASDVGN
jgi:hypothetical protein